MADPRPRSITPDTRLREVLDSYPEVEPALMDLSPSFRKLQNPILRRTVARVATLRQVATVAKVDLGTLLRTLQQAAGLRVEDLAAEDAPSGQRPPWAVPDRVAQRYDARPALEAGENPLNQVTRDLRELEQGQTYELVTSFIPAPLIEVMRQRGFRAWSCEEHDSLVRTYLTRDETAERQAS